MAIKVEVVSHHLDLKAERGRLLSDVLVEAGIPLSLYCRGRGLCGKCAVEVVSPPPPEAKEAESKLLARRGLGPRFRLACLHKVDRPVTISIPESSLLGEMPVLSWGVETPAKFGPAVRKYFLELTRADISAPEASWDILARALKLSRPAAALDVRRGLPALVERTGGRLTAVVYEDEEVLALEPGDTTSQCLGLAVDLGTTTLVMDLVDLADGRVLDSETALNSQTSFGADVVSRISLVFAEPDKAGALREAVVSDLNGIMARLLERNRRSSDEVYEVLVAGNTAMNHLLVGAPVATLALAPFTAAYSVLPPLPARDLGLRLNPAGRAALAPNIKSFVGGDISAGLLASGFLDRPETALYLDLGTNGEIALKSGEGVWVASTAAGPAFEGMNISHGMLALPGAIYRAEEGGETPKVFTIGGGPAQGICGTGLIDLVALGLAQGLVTPQGAITRPGKSIPVAPGIVLDQKDVRELQLAAGAIKSGARMMLASAGLRAADLDRLYIAGAFGSYLNIARAAALGLLPSVDPERITFLGNASLAGARVLLLSLEERRRLESAVAAIRHYSLASQPHFQETFIGSLEFARWS